MSGFAWSRPSALYAQNPYANAKKSITTAVETSVHSNA